MSINLRKRRWFWIDNDVLDLHGPTLGKVGLAVYCVLARFADNETRSAFPSRRRIAQLTHSSETTVQKALQLLNDLKLIEIVARVSNKGDRETNEYVLLDLYEKAEHKAAHAAEATPAPARPRVAKEKPPIPAAVQLVHVLTRRYPPRDLWDEIIRVCTGKDEQLVRECYTAWRKRGFSPLNLGWLDWVEQGVIPSQNGARTARLSPALEALRLCEEEDARSAATIEASFIKRESYNA